VASGGLDRLLTSVSGCLVDLFLGGLPRLRLAVVCAACTKKELGCEGGLRYSSTDCISAGGRDDVEGMGCEEGLRYLYTHCIGAGKPVVLGVLGVLGVLRVLRVLMVLGMLGVAVEYGSSWHWFACSCSSEYLGPWKKILH
jgi:hypothetical protein